MSSPDCATYMGSKAPSEKGFTSIDTHAHVFTRGMKMIEGRRYTPLALK